MAAIDSRVTPELLADAKSMLNITWEDAATDDKLSGILSRCMSWLDGLAGDTLDYTAQDLPRTLLFDAAMYMRDDVFNEFADDYQSELTQLITKHEVARYDAENTPDI